MILRTSYHRQRPGAFALWAIIALPVALLIAAVALYATAINTIAIQSNTTADAAAIAGCRTLVSDELLQARLYANIAGINDPPAPTLLNQARANAVRLGELNYINTKKITLDTNLPNHPDGEIIFGHVDHFAYQQLFEPTILPVPDPQYTQEIRRINSVVAVVRKQNADSIPVFGPISQNVVVGATAILDGDVVGFEPLFDTQTIPVAPIALQTNAWNTGIGSGGPSLPNITVALVKQNAAINPPLTAAILDIGSAGYTNYATQLSNGITRTELSAPLSLFGGEYSLDPVTNVRITPGLRRYESMAGGPDFPAASLTALQNLQATGRKVVFPIFTTVTPPIGTPTPVNPDLFTVTNFVAGTIQNVTVTPDIFVTIPPFPTFLAVSARVEITIRPTMLETPTAKTDFSRRPLINGPENNPYIAKVRLVK